MCTINRNAKYLTVTLTHLFTENQLVVKQEEHALLAFGLWLGDLGQVSWENQVRASAQYVFTLIIGKEAVRARSLKRNNRNWWGRCLPPSPLWSSATEQFCQCSPDASFSHWSVWPHSSLRLRQPPRPYNLWTQRLGYDQCTKIQYTRSTVPWQKIRTCVVGWYTWAVQPAVEGTCRSFAQE